ncbi:hypothetical protein LCGC14_3090530 [marine sediment metagenome]|uniref:Uncharacterized protein n=1 Tax=marine sediment metagenome TaxID=412755 RepID=A0A0F8WZF7_9ZZZZ
MGPNGTSLLHKLGSLRAFEMSEGALLDMVVKEQHRRSVARVAGRIIRSAKGTKAAKLMKLEDLGLAPLTCIKLRSSGKSDLEIIRALQQKGLL